MTAAKIAKSLVPPIVFSARNRLRPAEREYLGSQWPAEAAEGWADPSTQAVMRRNWPVVAERIAGTDALSILPYNSDRADLTAHNMLMTFLYVLGRAAHQKDRLSVLDWGGAIGHYALVARRLLPEIDFDYVVKEQPLNCELGGELNPGVKFVCSDNECFSRSYDVIMASSSLQYVEEWKAMLARLAKAADAWLFVTALPVVRRVPSHVVVQRLRAAGFQSDFYSHVMNKDEFVAEVTRHGFVLEREMMTWGTVPYRRAPEDTTGAGFLFKRN